jgi:hypothetical protein
MWVDVDRAIEVISGLSEVLFRRVARAHVIDRLDEL